MGRRSERLTLDNLGDLPQEVQTCVFWELDQVHRDRARGHEADEKRAWLSGVLRDWGTCGRILYVDEEYAGHMIWAPAPLLPGSASFAAAPASPDSVLVSCAQVDPARRHHGLGRLLVQGMAKDVLKHGGVRAIEAFAAVQGPEASVVGSPDQTRVLSQGGQGGQGSQGTQHNQGCVLPAGFWLSVGFATHRSHPTYPRMRMDLRSVVSWRDELENALERLTGRATKPAGQGALRG